MDINCSVVRRSPDQVACDMGGEVVILDLKSGMYFGLDAVAATIWTVIEQPASLSAIRDAIVSEYDVDAETCERDVLVFLREMQTAGLVEVSNGTAV